MPRGARALPENLTAGALGGGCSLCVHHARAAPQDVVRLARTL